MTEPLIPEPLWRIFIVLAGLCVGSFLNVCIYRLPLDQSVVRPRSRCPQCAAPIAWWQNIPVVSWLVLRGSCASCHQPISARYPAVEVANALIWLAMAWRYPARVETLILLPFASAMLALFFTDFDHQLLPDAITLPLAVLGWTVAAWNPRLDFAPGFLGSGTSLARLAAAAVGSTLGYGIFFTLYLAWKVFFKKDAIGGGDLKLMLGVGAFLGISGVVTTIFLASVVGTLLSLPFLIGGKWSMNRALAFGCFLTPAALLSALHGEDLVRWYLGLLMLH